MALVYKWLHQFDWIGVSQIYQIWRKYYNSEILAIRYFIEIFLFSSKFIRKYVWLKKITLLHYSEETKLTLNKKNSHFYWKEVQCTHMTIWRPNILVKHCWSIYIMKFIFLKWWTIPPISTKLTITSDLKSLNTKKRPRHMVIKIKIMAWDRHKIVAGLNWKMWSPLNNEKSGSSSFT